jgi:hypothetical protein
VEEHGSDLVQLICMLAQEPAQLVFDIDEFDAQRVMGRRQSLLTGGTKPLIFVIAMLAGMAVFELLQWHPRSDQQKAT